jgi:hypothetical protein
MSARLPAAEIVMSGSRSPLVRSRSVAGQTIDVLRQNSETLTFARPDRISFALRQFAARQTSMRNSDRNSACWPAVSFFVRATFSIDRKERVVSRVTPPACVHPAGA